MLPQLPTRWALFWTACLVARPVLSDRKPKGVRTTAVAVSPSYGQGRVIASPSVLELGQNPPAAEGRAGGHAAEGQAAKKVAMPFPADALAHVVKLDPAPILLGEGSSGSVWEVEDVTGVKETLKLFWYDCMVRKNKKQEVGKCFLTLGKFRAKRGNKKVKKFEAKVRRECDYAKKLQAAPDATGKGRARMVQCYGHNLDGGAGDTNATPLYLKLSYNGQGSIKEYLKQPHLQLHVDLEWVRNVFRQIAEGIQHLQSFQKVFIHHDMKIDNVIVWTHTDAQSQKYFTARLVDFGGMVDTSEGKPCRMTDFTPEISPPELRKRLGIKKMWCRGNYDPKYPEKFDIYSFGVDFVQVLSGKKIEEVANMATQAFCKQVAANCKKPPKKSTSVTWADGYHFQVNRRFCYNAQYICGADDFEFLTGQDTSPLIYLGDPYFPHFLTAYSKNFTKPHSAILERLRRDTVGKRFLTLIQKCLSRKPKDRPTVQQLLGHPWLEDVVTKLPPADHTRNNTTARRS